MMYVDWAQRPDIKYRKSRKKPTKAALVVDTRTSEPYTVSPLDFFRKMKRLLLQMYV